MLVRTVTVPPRDDSTLSTSFLYTQHMSRRWWCWKGINMNRKNQMTVLSVISGLLLIIAFFIKDQNTTLQSFIYMVVTNISFVIITIVLVNFIWGLLGGEPIENLLISLRSSISLLSDSEKSGVVRVIPTSGDYGTHRDWLERLETARSNIDLLGFTLHVWTRCDGFEDALFNLISSGVKVRILLMDENNPHFNAMINTSQIKSLSIQSVKSEIVIVTELLNSLIARISQANNIKGSLEYIKVSKGLIMCQICRIDTTMSVIQYMYSVNTPQNPLIIINDANSKMFMKYLYEFDSLWELNMKGNETNDD